MHHFSRLVTVLALLMLACCTPLPDESEEQATAEAADAAAGSAQATHGLLPGAPGAAGAQGSAGVGTPQASAQGSTSPIASGTPGAEQSMNGQEATPSDDDYAPASRINSDDIFTKKVPTKDVAVSHINALADVPGVKVALLIPITGESAELGHSLLDAAVLAVYDKYGNIAPRDITAKVQLIPEDTGDTIEGAEKAAQDAVQAGATIILGPVFGKQVSVVAATARTKNIPVVTFSNNSSVAGNGVYLFGFIPEQQVIRIVKYSLSRKITNIAALVPSTPYGAAIVKQLSAEVRKDGGRAHPIEYYSEDMSALQNNVGRLTRFIQDETTKNEALFIAEGGAKLKTITETLAANGLNSSVVQLLGTGLWDDADVLKWPALNGSWFASSPPDRYSTFEQHFIATYNYKPDRRASLSYDAVALASTLAITSSGKSFTTAMIIDPIGFSGPANGIFRFHEDGTIERGLCVLMVTPSGFKIIDPAPTSFNP